MRKEKDPDKMVEQLMEDIPLNEETGLYWKQNYKCPRHLVKAVATLETLKKLGL